MQTPTELNKPWKQILKNSSLWVLGILLIALLSSLFHAHLTKMFLVLPNVSGWDGAAHEVIMEIYAKRHFPSTWGWISNWYAGMPFPNLYPPLMYLLGATLTLITGSSIVAYKGLSLTALIGISASTFISLIFIFRNDFPDKIKITEIRKNKFVVLTIILSIATILGINSGSPGPRSLFYNSMLAQNISLIFLLPALYALISRSKFLLYIGAILWTLIYITNIHTAFSGLVIAAFLFIFKFLENKLDLMFYLKRYIFILFFGLLGASFWILPMLGSYTYFIGAVQETPFNLIILIKGTWPHLIIAFTGIYVAWRNRDKYQNIHLWSISIFFAIIFTFTLYFIQTYFEFNIPLPIYFHRWFETFFYMLVIPHAYLLLRISTSSTKKLLARIFILLIFALTLIYYINHPRTEDHIDKTYSDNRFVRLAKNVSIHNSIQNSNLILTQSFWAEADQDIIDAEIGRFGGYSGYSNLVESSINSLFFRISRNALSGAPDIWSLINYYRPITTGAIHLKHQAPLLEHLGVKALVLKNNNPDSPQGYIYAEDNFTHDTDNSVPGFSIMTFNYDTPFASIISGPIGLYIGENGFRLRNLSDHNYARFQETIFEEKLFNDFYAINVGKIPISDLLELQKGSTFAIIDNLRKYKLNDLDKFIQSAPNEYNIFIHNDESARAKELITKYSNRDNIVFFKSAYPKYPYNPIVSDIRSLSTSTITEKRLEIIQKNDTNISVLIPSSTKDSNIDNTQWIFLRSSFHPYWIPKINDVVLNSYMAAPGYTIIPVSSNLKATSTLSLTFPPSRLFTIGHILSLLIFTLIAIFSIYQYKFRQQNK